jgi:hypothetical protein
MSRERFVLAIGDCVDDVLNRDDIEIVEIRSTFVVVKATNIVAADIRRQCGRLITLLDGDRAARAAIGLFDRVPPRIAE